MKRVTKAEKAAREAMIEVGTIGLTIPRAQYVDYLELVRDDLAMALEAAREEAE